MIWVNLLLICLLLWGGVLGYIKGWVRTSYQLVALTVTICAAAAFKGDVRGFLTQHYHIDDEIITIVTQRLALPVTGDASPTAVLAQINLPEPVHHIIVEEIPTTAVADFGTIAELLATMIINVIAFCALLALWWGILHLLAGFVSKREEKLVQGWAGFFLGIFRNFIITVLIVGITTPFYWMLGLPEELLNPNSSPLLGWVARIFYSAGLWLN